ncbi:hypothetical protein [Ruthenibacterium lactatiformans]|uniref:hypothetical protein n=1 Tax=Ruthenibacterium lactatiformans TaxID=1550024 RepID=UPI00399FDF01
MQTEYRNINQGGRARRPARHAANVRVPPQSGGQRAARVRQPGPYVIRRARPAHRARARRQRAAASAAGGVTLGLACLTLAICWPCCQTSAAQPAGTEGSAARPLPTYNPMKAALSASTRATAAPTS